MVSAEATRLHGMGLSGDCGRPFLVLALEGGGYRGVFTAGVLAAIEETWGADWTSRIGLVAGTSTGSILAAGLAAGVPAAELARRYEEYGEAIFPPRKWPRLGLLRSRSDRRILEDRLRRTLPDIGFDETRIPLLVPVSEIGRGRPLRFRSWDRGSGERTGLVDVILAACAAPSWFDPVFVAGAGLLADGGLWAHHPALIAWTEARKRNAGPAYQIRILSIGAGRSAQYYDEPPRSPVERLWLRAMGWGFGGRWRAARLVELQTSLQSRATLEALHEVLDDDPADPQRLLHLSFESPRLLRFDDSTTTSALKRHAAEVFADRRLDLARFLGPPPGNGVHPEG